jgi:hypothetical protein
MQYMVINVQLAVAAVVDILAVAQGLLEIRLTTLVEEAVAVATRPPQGQLLRQGLYPRPATLLM